MADHKPTIDERLDRLTERHEALTQSVEMFIHETRDSHARLAEGQAQLTAAQMKTEKMLAEVVESINSLARIAHAHENRITHLEDRSPAA